MVIPFVWPSELYSIPLLVATGVALCAMVMAWRRRSVPGTTLLIFCMLGAAIWSFATIFELGAPTLPGKMLWIKIEYLGIATIPYLWFSYIVQYVGYESWCTRRGLHAIWIVPAITLLFIWTNESHHLVYQDIWLDVAGNLRTLGIARGPWYWVNFVYAYGLALVGVGLCIKAFWQTPAFYRLQIVVLAGCALLPMATLVIYILRLGPLPYLDMTPFAITLIGLLLVSGIMQQRLCDLTPVTLSVIFAHIMDGVAVLDTRQRVVDANPAMLRMLGSTMADVIGNNAVSLFQGALPAEIGAWKDAHHIIMLPQPEGQKGWFDLRITMLRQRADAASGWLLVLRDITEQYRLEARLNAMAYTDFLTGLPNRQLFYDRLSVALAGARRRNTIIAVLLLDLDGFKEVNDTLGHAAGDQLLKVLADRLTSCLREGDTVSRMGGDEFLVILPDLQAAAHAVAAARRILACCSAPYTLGDHTATVTASIGIALAPLDGNDAETLVRCADRAMYQAKNRGKNTYSLLEDPLATGHTR